MSRSKSTAFTEKYVSIVRRLTTRLLRVRERGRGRRRVRSEGTLPNLIFVLVLVLLVVLDIGNFKMDFRIFRTQASDEKNRPAFELNCFLLIPVQYNESSGARWHDIG